MKWHGWSTAQTRTPISRFGVRSVFHPWLGDLASLPIFPGVAKNSDGLTPLFHGTCVTAATTLPRCRMVGNDAGGLACVGRQSLSERRVSTSMD
jgi:hypothetical protein